LAVLGAALAGAIVSSLLACVPGLHVYSIAGLLVALGLELGIDAGGEVFGGFMLGMVVGYAVLNTIPGVFWAAPDESAAFVVLPGQRFLAQGQGYEAAVLAGTGALGATFLLLVLAPVLPRVLPTVREILAPHLHWILAAVSVFLIMSEWPKGHDRARGTPARLVEAWRAPAMGLLTFVLSGLLGLVLFYGSVLPPEAAFQNLMPAFTGLFALPCVLGGLVWRAIVPRQQPAAGVSVSPALVARGVGAGALGGLFAAFFPAITGGVGAFLAGHATAQRDDRVFLVSQGASKLIYYAGGFLLFFVPGLHLSRGGMAWLTGPLYTPRTAASYWMAVAALAVSAAVAFAMLLWLGRLAAGVVSRVNYRTISVGTLLLLVALIVALTGPQGLLVAAVATGIGLIPVTWGARRTNCLGVLLVPLTLQMAGLGPVAVRWLGLF
jgi:putative membrane protein